MGKNHQKPGCFFLNGGEFGSFEAIESARVSSPQVFEMPYGKAS